MQKHLNERIKTLIGQNLEYANYDVTNYYFEIDFYDEDYYEILNEKIVDQKDLTSNEISETINDFKEIIKVFKVSETSSVMTVKNLDIYLFNIKF